jgi:hypothetical protein
VLLENRDTLGDALITDMRRGAGDKTSDVFGATSAERATQPGPQKMSDPRQSRVGRHVLIPDSRR